MAKKSNQKKATPLASKPRLYFFLSGEKYGVSPEAGVCFL
jgi:hypothetical protein